jgi:hypothetical protein
MTASKLVIYLASFLIGIAACSAALFILVDRLVMPDRDVALMTYHEILLDQVPSPRIIIDSGSNSAYGIVPELIEAAFGQPTIVVADYAGVPIQAKIGRLEKYARAGDTVILPLEWQYYFQDSYPSDFIGAAIASSDYYGSSAYYFSLSTLDQFKFIIGSLNRKYIFAGLTRRFGESHRTSLQRQFEKVVAEMDADVGGDVKTGEIRTRDVQGRSCGEFISRLNIPISNIVPWVAERLAALQRTRHVKVVLTWPAVAGNDCYDFEFADRFVAQIKTIFGRAGIAVVSDPRRSLFSDDHVLNTYYHINPAAARERTERLIEDIEAAGLAPGPAAESSTRKFATAAVARVEAQVNETLLPLEDGIYSPGTEAFDDHFNLRDGWQAIESWGVWSRGSVSTLVFRSGPSNCNLILNAMYFPASWPSRISLNGSFIKSDDGGPIAIPPGGDVVTIELAHHNVKSPKELGLAADTRGLAFGLKHIAVNCTKLVAQP